MSLSLCLWLSLGGSVSLSLQLTPAGGGAGEEEEWDHVTKNVHVNHYAMKGAEPRMADGGATAAAARELMDEHEAREQQQRLEN